MYLFQWPLLQTSLKLNPRNAPKKNPEEPKKPDKRHDTQNMFKFSIFSMNLKLGKRTNSREESSLIEFTEFQKGKLLPETLIVYFDIPDIQE